MYINELVYILSYKLNLINIFLQNFSKNIFQKPIDKPTKICYSNKGSPSPIKKGRIKEHMFAIYLYGLICLNTDILLQGTKLSSDGLLYSIRVYILSTKKQALNRISGLPYISSL